LAKRGSSKPSGEVARREDLEQLKVGLRREFVQIVQSETFSGPLPPPEVMQGYEKVCPGAADRILVMAERQSEHRRSLEARYQTQGGRREWLGMLLGFILAAGAIGGGIYLVAHNHQAEGLTSIILALGGLVSVFVYARTTKRKELSRKWNQLLRPGSPRG
jgi:uncharacterized membrane protein